MMTKAYHHHQTECKKVCADGDAHFLKWKKKYEPWLRRLHSMVAKYSKANYGEFIEFVFEHSSGFLTEW